jgi:NAD-dependent deacetylase
VKNAFDSISGITIMYAEANTILDQLVPALQHAQHVVVLTGAGISAESGLPTFRDPMTGLWAQYRPEELGTPQAFRQNPRLVWEWFAWRRELVQAVAPNPAHQALAVLEHHVPKLTIVTQNVDGLHQQAGSRRVIELHGNLAHFKCFEETNQLLSGPQLRRSHRVVQGVADSYVLMWYGLESGFLSKH